MAATTTSAAEITFVQNRLIIDKSFYQPLTISAILLLFAVVIEYGKLGLMSSSMVFLYHPNSVKRCCNIFYFIPMSFCQTSRFSQITIHPLSFSPFSPSLSIVSDNIRYNGQIQQNMDTNIITKERGVIAFYILCLQSVFPHPPKL